MINVGFDRIHPTPGYPLGTTIGALSRHGWDSSSALVVSFKKGLKRDLRKLQNGKCCYCRRLLSDDGATHIEHFVEKGWHPEFAFEVRNLALACGTCNGVKNGHNLALMSALKKRAQRNNRNPIVRLPVLTNFLVPNSPYPDSGNDYRWVHPHFDHYSQNIRVAKGWVFAASTRKGLRTIEKIRLNAVSQIERRALVERMTNRGGRLSLLVGALAELDTHRARDVAQVVAKVLRRRRQLQAPEPESERA